MYHFRKQGAFTLIELLIVVAIIAILAAIAVPNFLEAQTRAKVSKAKADMRSLATAIESYYVDNNNYVPSYRLKTNGKVNDNFFIKGFVSVGEDSEFLDWLKINAAGVAADASNVNGYWGLRDIVDPSRTYSHWSGRDYVTLAGRDCYDVDFDENGAFVNFDVNNWRVTPGRIRSMFWVAAEAGGRSYNNGFFWLLSTPVSYIGNGILDDPWTGDVKADIDQENTSYLKYVALNRYQPVSFVGTADGGSPGSVVLYDADIGGRTSWAATTWSGFVSWCESYPMFVEPGHTVDLFGKTLEGQCPIFSLEPVTAGIAPADNGEFSAIYDSKIQWWALFAVGPDRVDQSLVVLPGATDPVLNNVVDMFYTDEGEEAVEAMVHSHIYDPSNGTKSQGEVWHIGGGAPDTRSARAIPDDEDWGGSKYVYKYLSPALSGQ